MNIDEWTKQKAELDAKMSQLMKKRPKPVDFSPLINVLDKLTCSQEWCDALDVMYNCKSLGEYVIYTPSFLQVRASGNYSNKGIFLGVQGPYAEWVIVRDNDGNQVLTLKHNRDLIENDN